VDADSGLRARSYCCLKAVLSGSHSKLIDKVKRKLEKIVIYFFSSRLITVWFNKKFPKYRDISLK
jgi:hypothetical protein